MLNFKFKKAVHVNIVIFSLFQIENRAFHLRGGGEGGEGPDI